MTENAELPLGIKPEKTENSPCCISSPGMEQEQFPEISFEGPHATLLMEKFGPFSTDDELTLTLRTKIKKYSDGEQRYDKCVKLACLAIVGDVVETEGGDEAGDEAEPKKPVRKLAGKKAEAKAEAAY